MQGLLSTRGLDGPEPHPKPYCIVYPFPMRIAAITVLLAISSVAQAQVLESKTFSTAGHPTEAMATPDGKYVLVTVNIESGHSTSSGIEIFAVDGDKLKKVAIQPLSDKEDAQGILLLPGSKPEMLAVGLSDAGVVFLPLAETLTGKAKVQVLPQGEQSGTGYLAVSPDGQFLFAANEYGDHGNIGVIGLQRDASGAIHPATLGQIRTPNTTPGITISPDGTRVYTESEVISPDAAQRLHGVGIPELQHDGCKQGVASPARPNGALFVIDAAKAEAITPGMTPQETHKAVQIVVDSGCSPVRTAVSPDGALVYVTARGDDKVLVFDTRLLESDPAKAFLRAFPSGGSAPIGLHLFDGGRKLLVANSDRFSPTKLGNAAVFDVSNLSASNPAAPTLLQTIKTGQFPRNITASPDAKTLFLTVYTGNELMVLKEK